MSELFQQFKDQLNTFNDLSTVEEIEQSLADWDVQLSDAQSQFTAEEYRNLKLRSFRFAGYAAGEYLNQRHKEFELEQRGLALAEQWQPRDFTDPDLQTQLLKLYVNCGITAGQLNDLHKAFELEQRGLALAEQWQPRNFTDPDLQTELLKLYANCGITAEQLNDLHKKFELYERGLALADQWLKQGQLNHESDEQILKLLGNQIIGENSLFQNWLKWGYWSWRAPKEIRKIQGFGKTQTSWFLQHWSKLESAKKADLTQQGIELWKGILNWHRIESEHRHLPALPELTPTEQLLKLSQGLYVLERLEERKPLLKVYETLKRLDGLLDYLLKTKFYKNQEEQFLKPLQTLKENIHRDYQLLFPKNTFNINKINLDNLKNWKKIIYFYQLHRLKKNNESYHHLFNQYQAEKNACHCSREIEWDKTLTTVKTTLRDWLATYVIEHLKTADTSTILKDTWHILSPHSTTYPDLLEKRCLDKTLPEMIQTIISHWFETQGNFREYTPPQAVDYLHDLFEHCLTVVPYQYHSNYDQLVHDWTTVALKEALQQDVLPLEKLFGYLEDARLALHAQHLSLNIDNWKEKTNQALFHALETIYQALASDRHIDPNIEFCPLITTSLEQLKDLLPQFSIADIQAKLRPHEIIIQPFIDTTLNHFRLLCLDQKNGLQLIDINDNCVDFENWKTLSLTWGKELTSLRQSLKQKSYRSVNFRIPLLKEVFNYSFVTQFAEFLSSFATDKGFKRLTVIFPAPLNQLPWEAICPTLAQHLVREISIQHWLDQHSSVSNAQNNYWLTADPSGKSQCMIKEINWLGDHLQQKPHVPCEHRYDLLKHLQITRHLHLSTHGFFQFGDPFKSHLTLNEKEQKKVSLWLLSLLRTNADVIVLSSCESCLTGEHTNQLITPVGLAPSLAAMGAKTVIGTLWACDGLAAWFFNYFFYQLAKEFPQQPWHLVLEETRQKLKSLTKEELIAIAKKELKDNTDSCENNVISHYLTSSEFPFSDPDYWAGFVMIGETTRR